MTKIKLNFKKVMLLVLAFTACNSQASWASIFNAGINKISKFSINKSVPSIAGAIAIGGWLYNGLSAIELPTPANSPEVQSIVIPVEKAVSEVISLATPINTLVPAPKSSNHKWLFVAVAAGSIAVIVGCWAVNKFFYKNIYDDFTRTGGVYQGANSIYDDFTK